MVAELVRPRGHKSNSGGPNALRFANGNINWNEVYRKYLSDIMTNQRAPNTVRGLKYIVKAREILKNLTLTPWINLLLTGGWTEISLGASLIDLCTVQIFV